VIKDGTSLVIGGDEDREVELEVEVDVGRVVEWARVLKGVLEVVGRV